MPKNVSCNSFYMFMMETKRRLESRGERFAHGMEAVVPIAAELWQNMSQEQKNVYKEKAKDYKKSDDFSAHKKEVKSRLPKEIRALGGAGAGGGGGGATASRRPITSQQGEDDDFVEPVPVIFPSDDEDAAEEFRKKHAKDRIEIIDSWRWNMGERYPDGIADMKCYVISVISHCRTSAYKYYPAEIGIVEFSLRNGVTNSFSRIIGPHVDMPTYLVPQACENLKTHRIPFESRIEGMTDNYVRTMEEILRFCRPSKHMRRIFCLSKEFNSVQGCVNFLQCKARVSDIIAERINCVDDLYQLFGEWRERVVVPSEWRPFNDCDGTGPLTPFAHNPGLLCDYHRREDVHRCALATAKRAAFYLLERIQNHYQIEPTKNHIPPPLPEGYVLPPVNLAAAAAASWQASSMALQQHLGRSENMNRDEDGMSMTSGLSNATGRTNATLVPPDEEDDSPQMLPMCMRSMARHEAAPAAWVDEPRSDMPADDTESAVDFGSPSVAGGGPGDTESQAGLAVLVDWNQNRDIRDMMYRHHKLKLQQYRAAKNKRIAVEASNNNVDRGHEAGGPALAAAANGPRAPGSSPAQGTQPIDNAAFNNMTTGIGSMRMQQPPPIVMPTPQNVPIGLTHMTAPGQQRGNMAPANYRMPPSFGAQSPPPIAQSPMTEGRLDANTSTENAAPRGPPVKTQSRVKQMMASRMRPESQGPGNE